MSCLLLPLELVFDFIIEGWFSLMQWILPKDTFSTGFRILLRFLIGIFSIILLVIFFIGILAAIATEATVFDLWKLIFIPLGISTIQIILGIVVRCIKKKNDKPN